MTAGRAKLLLETHPRTFVSDAIARRFMSFLTRRRLIRASCRLHHQFVRIPELSFLPEPQRDRRDLARQRDFGQFLAYATTDARIVEIPQRAGLCCGGIRRSFKHALERRVVIAIETTGQRCSPPAPQLAARELLIGAGSRD